jgi:hypothetical protein
MTTRTVRFDEETEKNLAQIRKMTGLSISSVLKEGLLAYQEKLQTHPAKMPFEVYSELDVGPGGYAIAPAKDARRAVREAIANKLKR